MVVETNSVTFDYMPGLAESWSVSGDGLTWTFNLRKDAVWSDGTPFTADDILFTMEIIYDKSLGVPAREILSLDLSFATPATAPGARLCKLVMAAK